MGPVSNLGGSFHIESHAPLLKQPAHTDISQRTLDAIVVPTIKPRSLQAASVLASEVGCALVVLCSTPGQARQALSTCTPAGDSLLVTHVSRSIEDKLLPHRTYGHPKPQIASACHVDIARKRNLGLALARLCGWRTIMYLDDDIRGMTASAVTRAAGLTACFQAVGFEISHYPDNSVVCHAHRMSGGKQDVFPGGSALVVDVERCDSLFPPVYNEDWLFLFDAVQNRSVTVAGALSQLEYWPFAHPKRAASEEFGDVIAEGLYRLVHEGVGLTGATQEYWRSALERRLQLIDDIAERLPPGGDAPLIGSALMSLAAARERLTMISALACVSFIRAWQADLEAWRQVLSDLPVVGELTSGAKFLDLDLPAPDRCVKTVTKPGVNTIPTAAVMPAAAMAAPADLAHAAVVMPPAPVTPAAVVMPPAEVTPAAVVMPAAALVAPAAQIAPAARIDPAARINPTARVASTAVVGAPFRPLLDGRRLTIDRETVVAEDVWIGDYTTIGQGVTIGTNSIVEDFVAIQPQAVIGPRVLVTSRSTIGIGVTVGEDSVIRGHVGDGSRIGAGCRIAGDIIHRHLDPSIPWDDPAGEEPGATVEDGAFIGWRALIVGAVTIGAGAYICAGALITKNVPAGYIGSGRNRIMHPSAWQGRLAKSPFLQNSRRSRPLRFGHWRFLPGPDQRWGDLGDALLAAQRRNYYLRAWRTVSDLKKTQTPQLARRHRHPDG